MNAIVKRLSTSSIVLAIAANFLGTAVPVQAAASVTLSIEPQTIATTGGTFAVPVKLAAGTGIIGLQFDLNFNPAVAQLKSIALNQSFWSDPSVVCVDDTGAALAIDSQFANKGTINNTTGKLTALGSAPLGVPDGGSCTTVGAVTVATLTFTAIGNGRSANTFSTVKIKGPGGSTVIGGDTSGTFLADGGFFQVGPVVDATPTATTAAPTATTVAPTATAIAPTATATSLPDGPTATATTVAPTATGVPATATEIPATSTSPTSTPLPTTTAQSPTATTTPPPATPTPPASPTTTPGPTAIPPTPISASQFTDVDAIVERTGFLSISTDKDIKLGKLSLGTNTATGKLTVKSNLSWQVTVIDYSPSFEQRLPKPWHLSQWNSASRIFVIPGAFLGAPLKVSSTQNTVSEGTPSVLLNGDASGQKGDEGQGFTTTYSQDLRAQDQALPSGQSYHLILNYVAYPTL